MNTKIKAFSLVEVLVTLVLTTVGLLGMAALQGKAIQYSNSSALNTSATSLANQMLDMMRMNRDKIYNAKGDINPQSLYFSKISYKESSCVGGKDKSILDCLTSNSDPVGQVNNWLTIISESLPVDAQLINNKFSIKPVDNNLVEVSISWYGDSECENDICTILVKAEL